MSTYRIRSGDTLAAIAARYHTSVSALAKANGIGNVNLIRAGATLTIPGSNAAPAGKGRGPAPAAADSFDSVPGVDLQLGARGAQVTALQKDLVKLGYLSQADMNTGPGVFGPHTQAAVKAFQRSHGVPQTGYFGPLTRGAMTRALHGGGSVTPAPSGGGSTGSARGSALVQ